MRVYFVLAATEFFIAVTSWPKSDINDYNMFDVSSPIWIASQAYLLVEPYSQDYRTREIYSSCKCMRVFQKFDVCYECLPANYTTELQRLKFKSSRIKVFRQGFLNGYENILYLDLNQHWELTRIEPGAFSNMVNLRNLSISYNAKLRSLEVGVFDSLQHLDTLRLLNNGFTKILDVTPALGVRYLPSLKKLLLNNNVFRSIAKDDFLPMSGTPLTQLNMVLCQIGYIHPEALMPLGNLLWLKIGENSFSSENLVEVLEQRNDHGLSTEGLNLYGMGLSSLAVDNLLRTIGAAGVRRLSLARNTFHTIAEDMFSSMPFLEVLDLRSVSVHTIADRAFTNLTSLKILLLGDNMISDLERGLLLPQLTHLDLSMNCAGLHWPSSFYLEDNGFTGMSHLVVLNLAGNNFVSDIHQETFRGLVNLRMLSLENITASLERANTFKELTKLEWLNMNHNSHLFMDSYNYNSLFCGLSNLQTLLMANCRVNYLSAASNLFTPLTSLQHLDLRENELLSLQTTPRLPWSSLRVLDMTGNQLTAWSNQFLPRKNVALKTLILRNNKLISITSAMAKDFYRLQTVDLMGNQFYCDCNFVKPLIDCDAEKISLKLNITTAFCANGPRHGKHWTVFDYVDHLLRHPEECEKPRNTNSAKSFITMLVVVSIVGTTTLILLGGAISYSYRWQIRYWVFLAKVATARRNRRGRPAPRSQTILYDAFVSHSNEDAVFVGRLVQRLESEEPRLKLCVYERDFRIGSVITEAVLASVYTSRRTLLVISNAFARSQWCRWETQLAEHHRLFTDDHGDVLDDRLVLVVFRPINKALLTPMLKYLLKTRRYIDWDDGKQEDCWKQLRDALGSQQKNQFQYPLTGHPEV